MKINYQWLKEFVDIELSPQLLASQLTMAGLAVDAIEEHGQFSVLDLDLTSNRPDCLSHLGIAREVSVLTGHEYRIPAANFKESITRTQELTSVEIEDLNLCPRYTARIVRGVRIGPSPAWVVAKLESVGLRSINNVADITNLVLLELGQPLHAFDLTRLAGPQIVVRRARKGESLTTLDGIERELSPEMLVIADSQRPVALAGIMGGAESEISDSTTDVLIESAAFSPASVRQTSRALGMSTEASYRFERGTDFQGAALASDRAVSLILEIAGGEALGGIIDVHRAPAESKPIVFRRHRYRDLTGLEVSLEAAAKILRNLGLTVEEDAANDQLLAVAPSWRVDLSIEEDLIEEVVRVSGYDRLKPALSGGAGAGAYLKGERGRRAVRRLLASQGFHEAISFSFVSADEDRLLSRAPDEARLKLQNPIDETQDQMRTTLLVGLLDAVGRNLNRGTRNVRLYELGKCFEDVGTVRPREIERLGLVITGARNENDWEKANERVDFFDIKCALEAVIENLGKNPAEFNPTDSIPYLHPGRAAVISLDGKDAGIVGQLHPQVASFHKLKQAVYVAEVDFGALSGSEAAEVRYRPLPKYPAVIRDLSLLLDEQVPFVEVESVVADLAIPELVRLRLFDLYTGRELPPGKRSLALSLRFRADDRTLTDSEINAAYATVVAALTKAFDAEIR